MTSISRTSRLMSLLREQAKTLKHPLEDAKARTAASPGDPARRERTAAEVKAAVISRVTALRERGVSDERIIRRAAIEEMLINRFPVGLANDAGFQRVVDNVEALIGDDTELVQAFRELVTGT